MWLVVTKGGPGSGKSTFAREFSRTMGWPLVDKDDIRDILDGPNVEQGSIAGALSYEIMLRVAARQLRQGLNVVCDSPLLRETYEHAERVATETGARLVVMECLCSDEDEWRKRVEERQTSQAPEHQTKDFDEARSFYESEEKSRYPIAAAHRIFDTNEPTDTLVQNAQAWLDELHTDDGERPVTKS